MSTLKLREGFYWTGIIDDGLRVFDIIMETKYGTTYNSYVLKTGGKTILFETAKAKFMDDYLDNLREVCDLTAIDYLVVNHTEPDHAGSVEKLLEFSPQMKILGTACAIGFLKEIVNRDFTALPVQDGQEVKIGDRTLRFLLVPNLHWPDTMYTFICEEQILLTCDSFGAHYCIPAVLRSKVTDEEGYQDALKYYFDGIIGPFKPFMLKALDRVEKMDISMICTGHGPVLDTKIRETMAIYRQWSTVVNPNPRKTVIIPYVSAYGYTAQLAEKISEGISACGGIDVRSYDLVTADKQKVLEEVGFADGILLGSPTILGQALEPIYELTLHMFPGTHGGKHAAAFGSYGWSGEAVPNLTERLKQLRMKVHEGYKVRFKPSEADLLGAYEYGYQFGCYVLDKPIERPQKEGGRKLVKCLVCGEIFDASLDVCPVCGVGRDKFVPVEDVTVDYRCDTQNMYLIVGGGAAGLNAAKAIRERDKTGNIAIVCEEDVRPYNRPMLTKALSADLTAEQVVIEKDSWYEENQVYTILGKKVASIDTSAKELVLESGEKLQYTKLILATGSSCFVPPIKGAEQEGVIAIRTLADVHRAQKFMGKGRKAVVVGGGVLGLEAAWELCKAGMKVTVMENAPVLMGRQLNPEAADFLTAAAVKSGVELLTGVNVNEIRKEGESYQVLTADGAAHEGDLVLISAGVRANTQLARQMGLNVSRAIVVDDHMKVAEDIYACGDCAEYQGVNLCLWAQAVEEGKVAGANAVGDDVTYEPVQAALSFSGFGTTLFSAGDNGKNENLLYKTLEFKDMGKGHYRRLSFLNGRLCGVVLMGDVSGMASLTQALAEHHTYKRILQSDLVL